MWDGATLSSVSISFGVANPHFGVPTLPTLSVQRISQAANSVVVALSTSDPQSFTPAPGSAAAWFASGFTQQLIYTCNQNNVIDNTQYVYIMTLRDESGANSIAGNTYATYKLNYTAVANMAPQ